MIAKINAQQRNIVTSLSTGLVIFKLLFGGVWLFVGGMGVYSLLTGGDVTVNNRPGTPEDVWLPGIFAVLGFFIFTFRYRRRIDIALNTVTTKWGFVLPIFGSTKQLAPINAVSIDRETRRTKNGSYTVYVVKLQFDNDEPLNVDESRDKQNARRTAESVSKMCNRPLQDTSGGETVERQVADLDKSLVDAEPQSRIKPTLPMGIESQVGENGQSILKLPSNPLANKAVLSVFPMLFILGFWWFVWHDPERLSAEDSSLFFKVFNFAPLIMFGIPILIGLSRVTTSGGPLKIANGEFTVGRKTIPIDELEELIVTHRGLVVHSDKATIRFGHGCSKDQLEQLREYIIYELHANRSGMQSI